MSERPLTDRPTADAEYPPRAGARPPVSAETVQRVVVLGYIMAVAMPPAGIVVAVVVARLTARSGSRHALAIVLVSLVSSLVWALIISGGALNTINTES